MTRGFSTGRSRCCTTLKRKTIISMIVYGIKSTGTTTKESSVDRRQGGDNTPVTTITTTTLQNRILSRAHRTTIFIKFRRQDSKNSMFLFSSLKINFFEVYITCMRILLTVSDRAHGDRDQDARYLCFLEAVVTIADRFKENEHKLQPFGHKELVEGCEEALLTILGKRPLKDFLCKGI